MINKERWDALRMGHTLKDRIRVFWFYIQLLAGNGDLLYNTCREIIDKCHKDDVWAHRALEEVFWSLSKGQRWPDYMVPHIPAAKYRDKYDMTQDPWILAYCCAVHLDRYDLIEKYKPSIRLFNLPDKWAWRRALLGKPNLWFLWRLFPHTLLNKAKITWRGKKYSMLQDFVYVFYGYMDQAYLNRKR